MNGEEHIISVEELSHKIDQDNSDSKFKIAAQLLLEAINDWPTLNLSELKEFLFELHNEVGLPLTLERITNYSKTLTIVDSAWKLEAAYSLIKIFKYDNTKTLDTIISELSEHYKST